MSKSIIAMKKKINLFMLVLLPLSMLAQSITYENYLQAIVEKNTEYLAEKYNVDIATAMLRGSRVLNDPELSVSYGNNQDWDLQMGQSVEVGLSYDLNFAGVRKARMASAQSEKDITDASVSAFLCSLRYSAAEAWAKAWSLRKNCRILEEAVEDMQQIASSDSVRLSLGEVGKTDALQTRLEAQALQGSLIAMQAEYQNALVELSALCGGMTIGSMVDSLLPIHPMYYSLEQVCNIAELNRADLKAAELSHSLSENNLRLLKATRAFELGFEIGYSHNTEVRNELAPAPKFNGLSIGVSIPLKFSSMNKEEVNAAKAQVLQSQKYYESAKIQVHSEASQAYNSLVAADKVLSSYDATLIDDARSIVESRRLGYLKGENGLVELLSAQQTFRDVMQGYIEACCNRFLCQSSLEQAIGFVWYEKE